MESPRLTTKTVAREMACLSLQKGTLARAPTAPGATHFQMEPQSAVLSFPRKRESGGSTMTYWMPAFAGMTGRGHD
jgi:hypothetical protein